MSEDQQGMLLGVAWVCECYISMNSTWLDHFKRLDSAEKTTNGIIAEDGREQFLIEYKFKKISYVYSQEKRAELN